MEFKKSGFNEEDSATLAGVAAMYQNVADDAISAGESANFIISQMKAFGLEAEDATHIIDALNEVSNTQAVSSADLANNLGKASAAMALGNNTYEQSLAMMTAITEINRSGAKSARALVSVQSRLTQVLDEQSSTGKALVEIYKGLGIALKDQNGQLRPTFEIFKDLAEKWPTLTTNQRDYIALTQAGANQTSNFVALMDNFEAALKAEATAMESSGSAARENAAYMESLEAQTTQLKATFQDFANNVIDKELVSSILTLANDALGILNTEAGKTITQWGLLTGVLTGGIVIYGQIAGKLLSAGSAVITLGKALSAGTATATMFTSAALPLAAAIGAIAVAGWKVYEWYKETHQPLSEYTSQIESNNEQLEKNKERLEEIEKLPWTEKTDEILAEKEALEKQNAELEKNIELNKELQGKAVDRTIGRTVDVYVGKQYGSANLTDTRGNIKYFKTYEEALEALNEKYGKTIVQEKNLADSIRSTGKYAESTGSILDTNYINILEDLTDELTSNNSLSEDSLELRSKNIDSIKEQVEAYQTAKDRGDDLTSSQERLIDAYNAFTEAESQAKEWTEKYGEALVLTEEQAQNLIKTYPELKGQIEKVGDAYYLVGGGALEAANKIMDANGNIVADEKATVDAVIAQIQRQLDAYAELVRVKRDVYAGYVKSGQKDSELGKQAEAEWIAAAKAWNEVQQARLNIGSALATGRVTYTGDKKETGIGTDTSKATTKKATDLALEEFKNLQKDLEHQKELGLIKEEEYYDKLEQLVKDYKAKATAHMKEYGTDVDTINRNMYQYEEEIYKGRAKLADDLAEQQKKAAEEAAKAQKEAAEKAVQAQKEALEKQKEALEKQKEDFETAVNYVIKQIDEEIDKLQDLRDQTEQYYDDKIDAVNKANDALEDQIQHEELLNNLAKAKDKQLYVFQNGQFQYVQDVEAIASAQAELDAYERDKALQKEVENLETLKEQALASIDKQIEGWEKYKEQWESVTTQYQEQQEKLLAEQVLGIDTEQKNWETRLENVQSFVDQYNSILNKLGSVDSRISSGTKNNTSTPVSGDGWHLDYSKGNTQYASAMDDPGVTNEWKQANSKSLSSAIKSAVSTGVKVGSGVAIGAISKGSITSKHASGTLSASGGLSLVGERGPELRVLNSGDGVIPADATRNLWDWGAYSPKDFMGGMRSDNIFHIGNIALPNVTDAKSFVNGLKQLAYQRAYKRA